MTLAINQIIEQLDLLDGYLQENGPENFGKEKKKQFWKIVGSIKRIQDPSDEVIEKAANIRETLHIHRFGESVPLRYVMPPLPLVALLLVLANVIILNDNDDLFLAGAIMYFGYIILFYVYFYIMGIIFFNEIITFIGLTIASIVEFLFLYYFVPCFLEWLVIFSALGAVPALYLYGRWIAGIITNIKIDGAIRDIYFFVTLKTNYKSYLSVSQNNRHWFFIISGLGTVFTSLILGIFELVYYDISSFLVISLVLFVGEMYSYIFNAGVWGGELGHARRERLILRDIKETKANVED